MEVVSHLIAVTAITTWGQIAVSALIGAAVAVTAVLTVGRLIRAHSLHNANADRVTGVANRGAFVRRLQREWMRSLNEHTRVGLMVIDVDAFGDINQLYGRATGDRVLAEVAERIRLRIRASDYVARVEGDEFGVICRDTTEEDLENLRRNLEAYVNYAQSAPVVLSIGIAVRRDEDDWFEDTLRRARKSVHERRSQRPIRAVDEAISELLS